MADKVLNDTAKGTLTHGGNELLCDSTIDDAAAFRGGAPPTQRTVVKYGGDVLMPNGTREEIGQLSFKQSEQHNVVDGRLGGEGYYGLRKPNAGSVDAGMQDIYRAYPEHTNPEYPGGAVVFEVPVIAPNLKGGGTGGGSQPSRVTRFYTDNGKFLINWQDDQGTVRAVIYRVFYKQDGTEDYIEFVGERQFWP